MKVPLHLHSEWSPANPVGPEDKSVRSKRKYKWICSEGHEYEATVNNRNHRGSGCPYCTGRKAWSGFNDLSVTNPDMYSEMVIKRPVTIGSNEDVEWECSNCSHRWVQSPNQRSSKWCKTCNLKERGSNARNRAAKSNALRASAPHLVQEWDESNELDVSEVSAGSGYRAVWKCQNGHVWEAKVSDRTRGRGCRRCGAAWGSKEESEVLEFVKSLGVNVEDSRRDIIPPQELDIYLPELKIAVEFNGVYWHTERFVSQYYHYDKWKRCSDKGIQLITVWEDDWRGRQDVVKEMLRSKIAPSPERIGARKTTVKPVHRSIAKLMLEAHHIQGFASGSEYIGLFHDDVLVAVGVFTRRNGVCYLDRYCSTMTVMGGLSKMLAYLPDTEFVTFANREVSSGNLYEATGWVYDGELKPDYTYLYKERRAHKFGFRKKRFESDPSLKFDPSLTERELAQLNNLPRIYDCGKDRYRYVKTTKE